jgi:hypothetical protein
VIDAFACVMWNFNQYDCELAMKFFVLSIVFCSIINRAVLTLEISPGDSPIIE